MKRCCANCFGDPGLTRNIIPMLLEQEPAEFHAGQTCDFCGSGNVATLRPSALSSWFEMVRDLYVVGRGEVGLVGNFKRDWRLFDPRVIDEASAQILLAEIFDDGEIVRRSFEPFNGEEWRNPREWEDLRDEMMHENRWFLKKAIELDRLEANLNQLLIPGSEFSAIATRWHRARIMSGDEPFKLSEMGAPPAHIASHGRANPAGISYLYLGSSKEACIAEVRPHPGQKVAVANFRVEPVKVLDLTDPRKSVSPFLLENREELADLLAILPLIERLGEELTKPVVPTSAAFEYTPSQYLCEFVKSEGYDGVVYRSSLSDGVNLALFDPGKAEAVDLEVFQVERVDVGAKPFASGNTAPA